MADPRVERLVSHLLSSGFADVKGARVSATVPVAEPLLNAFIASALPAGGPVRDVHVHPEPGDRLTVRVKMARPDFLPPIKLTLHIDKQPALPADPVLVLRVGSLPGLMSIAGPVLSLSGRLPPGVRLEGDRLLVNLATLVEHAGHGALLPLAERVRVTTEAGRLILDLGFRA